MEVKKEVVREPVKKEEVKEEVKTEETKKEEVKETATKTENTKFKLGDIVFVSKDADTDLEGFKLFPQYKKYTYTVEDYDAKSDVYTLRRLNLTLKLKSEFVVAPSERAHDPINRKQF